MRKTVAGLRHFWRVAAYALLIILFFSSSVGAQTDIYKTLHWPLYDPNIVDACAPTTGGTESAEAVLAKQTGLDPRWQGLIVADANKSGTDSIAMASILFWENRKWPAFERLVNGSPDKGMGPWQFTADTWANFPEYTADQVYDPIPSTDAASQFIKDQGGVAGSPGGSIDQDFSKGKNVPSMATVMKNYNAGSATYRDPGIAGYMQSGRIWYRGDAGNWANYDTNKPKIIDDYIVAGTYLYYQIASGQTITYKDDASYVAEALTKQDQIKNFSFGGAVTCNSSCTPIGPPGSNTVVLDPGHSIDKTVTDPQTGLNDSDSSNTATGERKAVWNVAQGAKSKLETAGYKVILTKSAEDQYASMRMRATVADNANAALAVSIHGDPGLGNAGEIYVQKDGLYRGGTPSPHDKTVFNNSALVTKSQQYAQTFQAQRSKVEGGNVVIKDNSFDGRYPPVEPGNIPLILLFSKAPWVYNERKMPFDESKYADGLVASIEEALPLGSNASVPSAQVSGCGAVAGSIAQTAVNYSWSDINHPADGVPNQAYLAATNKALAENKFVGGYPDDKYPGIDCGGFVTRVLQNSQVDPNYNNQKGDTTGQWQYLKDNPAKYQPLGKVSTSEQLQKGDIAIKSDHTYLFVGSEPGFGGNAASASIKGDTYPDGKAPTAVNAYGFDEFEWFRPL